MKILCPKCNTEYDLPDEYLGKKLQCANCEKKFYCNPENTHDFNVTKTPPIATLPKDIQINKSSVTIKAQQQQNSIESQKKTLSLKINEVKKEDYKTKFTIKKNNDAKNEDKVAPELDSTSDSNPELKSEESILHNTTIQNKKTTSL